MLNSILSVKPYPDFEKEVISYDKKGNRYIKKVKSTDNFLVTMNNGNSIVVDKKELKELGINNFDNVVKSVEDFDEDDNLTQTETQETTTIIEETENTVTENSPLILK